MEMAGHVKEEIKTIQAAKAADRVKARAAQRKRYREEALYHFTTG